MSGLEDRYLKNNIPGKHSWWDDYKDDDKRECEEDISDDYNAQHWNEPNPSKNSGVGDKNEILDCTAGASQGYLIRGEEDLSRCLGSAIPRPCKKSILVHAREQERRDEQKTEGSDTGSLADDDTFLSQYRRKRLEELKQQEQILSQGEGRVKDVSPVEYSTLVDEGGIVVVHLYEVNIPECEKISEILEKLARNQLMKNVRFLSLRASRASQTLDRIALPSILIHRSGQLIGNLTPITHDLPNNFTLDDVHGLLQNYIGTLGINHLDAPSRHALLEHSASGNDSDLELDEFCKDFDG